MTNLSQKSTDNEKKENEIPYLSSMRESFFQLISIMIDSLTAYCLDYGCFEQNLWNGLSIVQTLIEFFFSFLNVLNKNMLTRHHLRWMRYVFRSDYETDFRQRNFSIQILLERLYLKLSLTWFHRILVWQDGWVHSKGVIHFAQLYI